MSVFQIKDTIQLLQDMLYNQIVAMRNRLKTRVSDFVAVKSQDISYV
jgi:hypothetical protein